MNHTTDFKVRINCMTYNHAPYIEDAMNGFCMQQTDFPYVAIIVDDASTDGEQEVVNHYIHEHFDIEEKDVVRNEETDDYVLTFSRHKENKNCFFAVFLLKYNHYSIEKAKWPYYLEFAIGPKYIAMCEGDDYWTDHYKLQKQVDYLDSHHECGLVYTNSLIYKQHDNSLFEASLPKQSDFRGLLLESPIMTLTTCFRNDISKKYPEEIKINPAWLMGDLPLWLFLASQSEIKYLPDVTSVYRVLDGSASHSGELDKDIRFCMSSFEIRKFYAEKYHSKELVKQICVNHINELFKLALHYNHNVSCYAAKLAYKENIPTPKVWLKILLYTNKIGRACRQYLFD